jgi:nanoRNase/pAp phosphatase (c-di-AMP/oligoRNAs hydrolase)
MFDTKLKLRYLLSDLKILTQKIRVSSFVTNNDQLILVDPVDDEDVEEIRPRTDPQNVLQCDLKKRKNINTHPIYIVIDHHFLHWLWQIFLM